MTTEMTTELTTIERAHKALAFAETKTKLAELAQSSVRIVEITNAAGREECHAAAMALTKQRTTITATGKAARDDANKFSAAVIAAEKDLLAIITPEETRLRGLRDKWDADRDAERQAAIDAERKRVADIQQRIQDIKDVSASAAGCNSQSIADAMEVMRSLVIDDTFAEFAPQAQVAKDEALAKLRDMHAKAVFAEAEAKRVADEQAAAAEQLRKDREELDRLRAEAAERQAEADAEAEADRALRNKVDGILRMMYGSSDLDEVRNQLSKAQALQIQAGEYGALTDEARANRECVIETLKRRIAETEELRAERAKIAEQAAELKRQQDEQAARDRAARDAQLAMERKAAHERIQQEIDNATLEDAAQEAVGLLTELGEGDHITTRKLAAALAREVVA